MEENEKLESVLRATIDCDWSLVDTLKRELADAFSKKKLADRYKILMKSYNVFSVDGFEIKDSDIEKAAGTDYLQDKYDVLAAMFRNNLNIEPEEAEVCAYIAEKSDPEIIEDTLRSSLETHQSLYPYQSKKLQLSDLGLSGEFGKSTDQQAKEVLKAIISEKQIFDSLPLETRYQKLLDIHLSIHPNAPKEAVDKRLKKMTESANTSDKYELLRSTLSEQTDFITSMDNVLNWAFAIGEMSEEDALELINKIQKSAKTPDSFVRDHFQHIEERFRFKLKEDDLKDTGHFVQAKPTIH